MGQDRHGLHLSSDVLEVERCSSSDWCCAHTESPPNAAAFVAVLALFVPFSAIRTIGLYPQALHAHAPVIHPRHPSLPAAPVIPSTFARPPAPNAWRWLMRPVDAARLPMRDVDVREHFVRNEPDIDMSRTLSWKPSRACVSVRENLSASASASALPDARASASLCAAPGGFSESAAGAAVQAASLSSSRSLARSSLSDSSLGEPVSAAARRAVARACTVPGARATMPCLFSKRRLEAPRGAPCG
jgi:hypothetical protein